MVAKAKFPAFTPGDIRQIGAGLNRPECVLATQGGDLFAPDWTLGIARIAADGSVSRAVEFPLIEKGFLPNGIALMKDRSFLFANLGAEGGVWRVGPTGPAEPFALQAGSYRIPPANFVLLDGDRVWITVSASTRAHKHFTGKEDTGAIILVERGNARVVADGLTWTNELRISRDGRHLFVNETFACRTTRYELGADGSLGGKQHVAFAPGTFPDGLAIDAEDCVWAVCPVSNRIIRIMPDLSWQIVFEDFDCDAFTELTRAYSADRMTRDMIVESKGSRVSNLTSIAFGGPDLKTIYLGALTTPAISYLKSAVAGVPMQHWN